MSQLIIQIYRLSHTSLRTKARVVKVKHDLLHVVSQENQKQTTTFLLESTRNEARARRLDIRVLFVAQCTLVKRNAFCKKVMNSRICIPFYIFFLSPDYVTARSLRSNNLLTTVFSSMISLVGLYKNTTYENKNNIETQTNNSGTNF